MSDYGLVAVIAAREIVASGAQPADAWKAAAATVCRTRMEQNKGCPRGAFLGLCEEGLVKGVPPGQYTKSRMNKAYALKAMEILQSHPELAGDVAELWARTVTPKTVGNNGQADVVVELWVNNLFVEREHS